MQLAPSTTRFIDATMAPIPAGPVASVLEVNSNDRLSAVRINATLGLPKSDMTSFDDFDVHITPSPEFAERNQLYSVGISGVTSFSRGSFLDTVRAAAQGAGKNAVALLQAKDGAFYISSGINATLDGDGDGELRAGDISAASTPADARPRVVAIVAGDEYADLR